MIIQKTCRGCGRVFWMKVPSKKSKKKQNPLKLTHCQTCRNRMSMGKQSLAHKTDYGIKDDVNLLVHLENANPKLVDKLRNKHLNKTE